MAEMTIQKSQAFPVGKDLNKGKSLEDNKASLDFNAFLRSSKEDTVKNENSKSQEDSEKKNEQDGIEKDPKEAKLQKGEKKTEKKETKSQEQDSLQGEKAVSLVSEKQIMFQKDQIMADFKLVGEEISVEAIPEIPILEEPVSFGEENTAMLSAVSFDNEEATPVLTENTAEKDFSDFLKENQGKELVENKESISVKLNTSEEAPVEENMIPSQRLEEKLSRRTEEKKLGTEEKLSSVEEHIGQQLSIQGSQEKIAEPLTAKIQEEAVLQTGEAELPEDVATFLSEKTSLQNGEIKIELEPRNLGQITVKLNYSGGKANIVITAENPKTLHLLQSGAEDMGRILEQKTGEITKILVQEEQQAPSFQQQGQSTSENKEEAERRQREQQKRAQQDNAEGFLQRMRLGLAQ